MKNIKSCRTLQIQKNLPSERDTGHDLRQRGHSYQVLLRYSYVV